MKKLDFIRLSKTTSLTAYGDEGEAGTPAAPVAKPEGETKFTQEQVNQIVQERLAREKEVGKKQVDELVNRLTEIEQKATLTDEERKALKVRLEELKNEALTTEEKLTRENKTLKENLDVTAKTLSSQVDGWKTNFFNFRIERELNDAAVSNDARVPFQLVNLLKPMTQMKEVTNSEGVVTGYDVKVTITDYKEDGTPFTMELAPAEAVAKLREMPQMWGNQFNARSKDGLGQTGDLMNPKNTPVGSGIVIDKGFEAYMKSRNTETGKSVLGIKESPLKT